MRVERTWTQQQLAEISSLSLRTIQRAEKHGNCSYETLLAIASAFDVDVSELTQFQIFSSENSEQGISLFGINFFKGNSNISLIIGIIIMLPAVYFLVANVLNYNFGISFMHDSLNILYSNESVFRIFNSISPFIFLGGLLTAFTINLLTLLSLNINYSRGKLKSSIALTLKPANLIVVVAALLAFSTMFGYAVIENLLPH
jgi:transcriptional regulator with XRE-family HTH domain